MDPVKAVRLSGITEEDVIGGEEKGLQDLALECVSLRGAVNGSCGGGGR